MNVYWSRYYVREGIEKIYHSHQHKIKNMGKRNRTVDSVPKFNEVKRLIYEKV